MEILVDVMQEARWNIVLADAVGEEAVHSDTEDHNLGSGSIPKEALELTEQVVVAGRLQKDRIDAHPGRSQLRQAPCVNPIQQKRFAYHEYR